MTSILSSTSKRITRCREEQTSLLEYSNENRKNGGICDVILQSGDIRLAAHKLVLSCYCEYFKIKFNSPAYKECYETIVIDVEGKSLKILLEYIYTGKISIDSENVIGLLQAAHYLWLEEVKQFCIEYLKSILTPRNCLEIYKVAEDCSNDSLKQDVYKLVKENYKVVSESVGFINLPYKQLFTCLSKNIHLMEDDELLCTSIIKWVKHDESKRKKRLTILIRLVHFENLSSSFLKTIIAEKIVQENEESMKLINQRLSSLFNDTEISSISGDDKKNKVIAVWPSGGNSPSQYPALPDSYLNQRIPSLPNDTKIISIGGSHTRKKVITIWPLDVKSPLQYPDLPYSFSERDRRCLRGGSIEWSKYIYCIGGRNTTATAFSDRVWRLNTNQSNLKWQLVSSMKMGRSGMGAVAFKDILIVVGGRKGWVSTLSSSEAYHIQSDEWREIAWLRESRSSNQLVVCAGYLYTLGGMNAGLSHLSSVQRLRGLNGMWEDAPSMQTARWCFAAVVCDDVIYAIGGQNASGEILKSVEKFDPAADERWVYVSDMNIERYEHSACVFNGKIFVVGGEKERDEAMQEKNPNEHYVKEIECYYPSTGSWEIVGKTKESLCSHSLIVL